MVTGCEGMGALPAGEAISRPAGCGEQVTLEISLDGPGGTFSRLILLQAVRWAPTLSNRRKGIPVNTWSGYPRERDVRHLGMPAFLQPCLTLVAGEASG